MSFLSRPALPTSRAAERSHSGISCATPCGCGPIGSSSARSAAAEAFDMMQAMNTGHNGSMSTVHANSAREALARIENMILMGTGSLPIRAIRTQLVGALDLVIQTERMRDGVRRVTEVVEVVGMEGDVITLSTLFRYKYEGETSEGTLRGRFEANAVRPHFYPRVEYFGLGSRAVAVARRRGRSSQRMNACSLSLRWRSYCLAPPVSARRYASRRRARLGEGTVREPHRRREERPDQERRTRLAACSRRKRILGRARTAVVHDRDPAHLGDAFRVSDAVAGGRHVRRRRLECDRRAAWLRCARRRRGLRRLFPAASSSSFPGAEEDRAQIRGHFPRRHRRHRAEWSEQDCRCRRRCARSRSKRRPRSAPCSPRSATS